MPPQQQQDATDTSTEVARAATGGESWKAELDIAPTDLGEYAAEAVGMDWEEAIQRVHIFMASGWVFAL